jgi:transcription factor STE12
MYPQGAAMAAQQQKPETFMLSTEAQQSLPHDAQVALQQVDNREYSTLEEGRRAAENRR